jgi:hypothetical protein
MVAQLCPSGLEIAHEIRGRAMHPSSADVDEAQLRNTDLAFSFVRVDAVFAGLPNDLEQLSSFLISSAAYDNRDTPVEMRVSFS